MIETSCKNVTSILTKSFFLLANTRIWRLAELIEEEEFIARNLK